MQSQYDHQLGGKRRAAKKLQKMVVNALEYDFKGPDDQVNYNTAFTLGKKL